jgi:hypothetical protein
MMRQLVSGQPAQRVESGLARHLDVEEEEVGPVPPNRFDRLIGVVTFGHDRDVRKSRESRQQAAAGRRLVIGNDDAQRQG